MAEIVKENGILQHREYSKKYREIPGVNKRLAKLIDWGENSSLIFAFEVKTVSLYGFLLV